LHKLHILSNIHLTTKAEISTKQHSNFQSEKIKCISRTQLSVLLKEIWVLQCENYMKKKIKTFLNVLLTSISIHPCNENQLDSLFILSLFRQSTSTCFGHICSPSSGGILYTYNNWYVLYIYSIPPDDGLQTCPKHVEVECRNKLRINSASNWFSLHENKNYLRGKM